MKNNSNPLSKVKAATLVRLIVLVLAIANLILSMFTTYRLPGLSEVEQQSLAVIFTAVISFVSYWYNNSWSSNATTADKVLDTLKNTDVTVDELMEAVNQLQEEVERN